MRILAIRGCNLASLAGEFTVDFGSEPLHSAGLFAISGPTGAGKSTLLDALCLALYEATPRLARAGARGIALPDVKEETVTPQDVRNLLRRGATEGHAEVDFLGNDGIAYRARWSVRRARNRADGRLQDSEMRLWQLPELQPLGGRNVEVKAEIARRIGLNFDQFTRAVLLAQNEFSAFLKAGDNERGELLETLTGSGIYTEISRLAFERAKEETAALERLTERLEHALPLADEDRQRLESEAGAARVRLAELEARHAALERLLHWQNEMRALQTALDEARIVRERRRQELQSADAQRARLAEVEAVQPARAILAEHARLASEVEACRTAIAECESRLARANEARQAGERAREDAAQALRAAEGHHAELAAGLNEARALDARIEAMRPEHAQSRRSADDAAAAAAEARSTLETRMKERGSLGAEIDKMDAWLGAHAADGAMAAQWQRCDILLVQAREHRQLALAAAQAASAAAREQGDGAAIEARQAQAHAAAAAAAEARRRERDACSEKLRALETQRTPAVRARLAEEQQQLLEAERLCRALHDAQLRRSEALDDMMRHAETLAAAQRAWQEAQAAQPGIAAALAQAERSQKRAEAAASASVEQLRAHLSDGEPCPVCGASEHPYRDGHAPLKAMLIGLADETAACREAARRNTEALATHRALADAALAAQREAERRIAEHDAALASAGHAWRAHALHGSDPALSAQPHACAAWLAQRQAANAERLREIDAAEQAYATAAAERDAAQSALDAAMADAETCRAALDATRSTNAEAARKLIAERERERDAHARLDAGLDALDALDPPSLPRDWRAAWHAAPEDFHCRCRAAVSAWEAQRALRADASTRSAALDAEWQVASGKSAAAEAERQRTATEHALRDAALRAQQDARTALFAGKPAAQVEAESAARIAAARAAQDAAASAERQSALEAMRCAEARDRTRERQQELLAQQQDGARRIAEWLAEHHARHQSRLDAARLDELLEHDADWIRAQREALAALEAALREADAVHSERERRLAAHGAARSAHWPQIAAEELDQALDALRVERQSAQKEAAAHELALSSDDKRRADAAETRVELEGQQATQRRWAQLSELIGSADGKKFRNYAQQTTLDVLLAYANRHLSDLARRYRLERVRDTLALLVIDGDMGGEMRSVHSLSGGESFLVSLALALGLASLSSNGVRVESLFIDEGFGSLDAETLRVAMDALDGLQAMGRRVGVISHVQEMTERIATRILVRRVAGGRSQVSVAQGQ